MGRRGSGGRADSPLMNPDRTLEQMKSLFVEKLRENGFPGFVARFFASVLKRMK